MEVSEVYIEFNSQVFRMEAKRISNVLHEQLSDHWSQIIKLIRTRNEQ